MAIRAEKRVKFRGKGRMQVPVRVGFIVKIYYIHRRHTWKGCCKMDISIDISIKSNPTPARYNASHKNISRMRLPSVCMDDMNGYQNKDKYNTQKWYFL